MDIFSISTESSVRRSGCSRAQEAWAGVAWPRASRSLQSGWRSKESSLTLARRDVFETPKRGDRIKPKLHVISHNVYIKANLPFRLVDAITSHIQDMSDILQAASACRDCTSGAHHQPEKPVRRQSCRMKKVISTLPFCTRFSSRIQLLC